MKDKVHNRIFALDIGTRTVVGIMGVGSLNGDVLDIIDVEVMEHTDRNMFDGQIHDIDEVAAVVKQVRKKLEARNKCQLTHVCIAAAGRALITRKVMVEVDVEGIEPADKTFISSLELKAMQKSQQEIQEKLNKVSRYYCVGYSVVNYYLNGVIIKNLEGHRGSTMGVEVISTFLPRTVVDSLYTVMERVNLEVINLTLEPIAAIKVAIPENLRLLNLAMVDIGAGTSDIAITRTGAINAYSMVSMAGDEITETIAQHFLTDFYTAERMKIEMSRGQDVISYRDVLGNQVEVTGEEILEIISTAIDTLVEKIANSIMEYNQGPPSALFCIGGGSCIPGIKERFSDKLGIPVNRVGIKHLEEVKGLKISVPDFNGPETITPVGIALTGFVSSGDHFLNVMVNGKNLHMFNTKQMTITDVLLAVGFNPKKLIPSRGPSVRFYLNGEMEEIKGHPGQPAVIDLNGRQTGLNTMLHDGDVIKVKEAVEGEKARPTVGEIAHSKSCQIMLAGKRLTLPVMWTLNGNKVSSDTVIKDDDRLVVTRILTLEELINSYELPRNGYIYRVNGKEVSLEYNLKNGDNVHFIQTKEDDEQRTINIKINGKMVKLPYREKSYMFVDVFNFIDFDLRNPRGRIELIINGVRAGYTDTIKEGDDIRIFWNKCTK